MKSNLFTVVVVVVTAAIAACAQGATPPSATGTPLEGAHVVSSPAGPLPPDPDMPVQLCGVQGIADIAFVIPPGTEYGDWVPGVVRSPELVGKAGSLVVLYEGSVRIPYLTGIPGATRDDVVEGAVCVVTPDGERLIYSGITRDGLTVPNGMDDSISEVSDESICLALPESPTCAGRGRALPRT